MNYETMTEEQQHALNLEYRARLTVPDADDFVKRATNRSAAVRDRLTCHLDVSYGDTPKQTLDVFPADRPGAPVFFYIHGGYWFQLDKDVYSEVAEPMTAAGATTVLPNYDLCPDVTIPDIVDQVRRALVLGPCEYRQLQRRSRPDSHRRAFCRRAPDRHDDGHRLGQLVRSPGGSD